MLLAKIGIVRQGWLAGELEGFRKIHHKRLLATRFDPGGVIGFVEFYLWRGL